MWKPLRKLGLAFLNLPYQNSLQSLKLCLHPLDALPKLSFDLAILLNQFFIDARITPWIISP
jgi:hypothetical protein